MIEKLSEKNASWQVLPVGWKKLNFDGASSVNPGQSVVGAIIKNKAGEVVHALSGSVGIATNNVAEIATLEGNKAADQLANMGIEEGSAREFGRAESMPIVLQEIISMDRGSITKIGVG
ncbi:hypothetical protein SUGI_0080880 [Cryptomeria japonica]|nr:hypothetical protein SUGI_0080880 [Cryptomeria japonica]